MIRRICCFLVIVAAGFCPLSAQHRPEVVYTISLAHGAEHMLNIAMEFQEDGARHAVLLPVWNALYQVRDFAQFVSDVHAYGADGKPIAIAKKEKSEWMVSGSGRIRVTYSIYASDPGPFGAEVSLHHAFLNLAEVLMFTEPTRHELATVKFTDVPLRWNLGVALPSLNTRSNGDALGSFTMHAQDYDHLVDSPVELGTFTELHFSGQAGEVYRVIVDGEGNFDHKRILEHLKKITAAETQWMQDVPYKEYTFIYHFRPGTWGGMEHSYSTAIDVIKPTTADEYEEFDAVSAHEFFHLWNVKRIRPRSLEPVDYMRENYTDALWFCEGITTTVARMNLLAAGLLTPDEYIDHLASEISTLQSRPAHSLQTVEESSVDTWFDKYRYYRGAERSINYYNKGDVLGVLLDLAIRDATHGQKSLRDVFLAMNAEYGKTGRNYNDSEAVRQVVEAVTGTSFEEFFRRYIAGTDELPYQQLYKTVGMKVETRVRTEREMGFDWTPAGSMWVVRGPLSSQASAAGLEEGDVLAAIEHRSPADASQALDTIGERNYVSVTISHGGSNQEISVPLLVREVTSYRLVEDEQATPEQLQRRKEWLGKAK